MSDARPILFFDSGVGGLSVVAAARKTAPHARFVYTADSAGFPYGVKTETEIAARVPTLLGRLAERYDPRLIVIACNTASTIALGAIRAALDIPIVGTVPAIKPAAEATRTKVIAVLGTEATVRQGYVDDLAMRYAADCRVIRHGSAELVELAESKLRGHVVHHEHVAEAVAAMVLHPHGRDIDTVVLACTHFPLLADELQAAIPQPVCFVDGGAGIARRITSLTEGQAWDRDAPDVAVFTRIDASTRALAPALERYGFGVIEAL